MQQLTRSDNNEPEFRPRITWWAVILCIGVCAILFCIPGQCQTTTVSATVVDQASTVWANGTWKTQFVPNPNASQNVTCNGTSFPSSSWANSGVLDGSGNFSQSLTSNNFCAPSGSTYTLTVCPNATSACTVIQKVTVQGSTLNLSSLITSNSPAPSVLPLPLARAYNDNEVTVNPSLVGYFYLNVTNNQPKYWGQDGAWHTFVTGVSSISSGNLPPIFVTDIGGTPSTPEIDFTFSTVQPNTVLGNCTTSIATAPDYCLLTAAMIPPLPYIPSSTNIFYQNVSANGVGQNQRQILYFTNKFTITDSSSPSQTAIDLASSGVSANTYPCPTSLTINSSGQTTSATAGTCPTAIDQYSTVTGCTPPSSTDSTCTGTITIAGFADANYQPFLQVNSINGSFLFAVITGSLTSNSIPYTLTCTFNCGTVVAPTIYVHAHHN